MNPVTEIQLNRVAIGWLDFAWESARGLKWADGPIASWAMGIYNQTAEFAMLAHFAEQDRIQAEQNILLDGDFDHMGDWSYSEAVEPFDESPYWE